MRPHCFVSCIHPCLNLACLALVVLLWAGSLGAADRPGEGAAGEDPELLENIKPTSLPFEELLKLTVEAVSKREQLVEEAPSSVTILTGDESRKHGHRTLGDMLRSVAGLHVSYDRTYQFLGTRGFNRGDFNSRVLVLVDGHRVNNSLTDGAYIGTAFLLDVGLIDRVEVVRGPGSVVYGNNAFFGVINVITRRGADMAREGAFGYGAEVSTEWGRYGTAKTRVSMGHQFTNRLEGLEFVVSGSIYESDGRDELFYEEYNEPGTGINGGVAEDLDGDSADSLFGKLSYHDFTLQAAWVDRKKSIPTAPGVFLFNDPLANSRDKRWYVNLKFEREVMAGEEELSLMGRIYYDRSDFQRAAVLGDGFRFDEMQVGEWWGAEAQATRRFWDRATLTLGSEYRSDFRQESELQSQNAAFVSQRNSRSRENYGVYFQGDVVLVEERLHFTGGIRYDNYQDVDSSVNPRLGLIHSPWEGTVFKAIFGTAFRVPNFRELADPRFGGIGSEEIVSYELVYEQQINAHLRSSVAGFYNQIEDLIAFHSGAFTNLDARAYGVELGLEGVWAKGWRARVSYTVQEVVDVDRVLTSRILTDAPRHLAKANLIVPLFREKVFASAEYQFTSSRNTARTTTSMGPLTIAGEDAASFGVLNLSLYSRNLLRGLELSASVYNVLNQGYDDPSTPGHRQDLIPQDRRTYNLQLSYRF